MTLSLHSASISRILEPSLQGLISSTEYVLCLPLQHYLIFIFSDWQQGYLLSLDFFKLWLLLSIIFFFVFELCAWFSWLLFFDFSNSQRLHSKNSTWKSWLPVRKWGHYLFKDLSFFFSILYSFLFSSFSSHNIRVSRHKRQAS